MIARAVVDFRVVWRQQERSLPVEAVSRSSWRTRTNEATGSGLQMNPTHAAILTFEIDLIRIIRINERNKPVA